MEHGNMIGAQAMGAAECAKDVYQSRTIGDNIDYQIARHRAEIERLTLLRHHLQRGDSLLTVRIEDLRQAMNY